ncbi:hypothetical protein FB451DRAFT_1559536 [Mycena latifolia]|nr:hypothetical protein FB451DRAFT_1559536 [Mycena latifolia]
MSVLLVQVAEAYHVPNSGEKAPGGVADVCPPSISEGPRPEDAADDDDDHDDHDARACEGVGGGGGGGVVQCLSEHIEDIMHPTGSLPTVPRPPAHRLPPPTHRSLSAALTGDVTTPPLGPFSPFSSTTKPLSPSTSVLLAVRSPPSRAPIARPPARCLPALPPVVSPDAAAVTRITSSHVRRLFLLPPNDRPRRCLPSPPPPSADRPPSPSPSPAPETLPRAHPWRSASVPCFGRCPRARHVFVDNVWRPSFIEYTPNASPARRWGALLRTTPPKSFLRTPSPLHRAEFTAPEKIPSAFLASTDTSATRSSLDRPAHLRPTPLSFPVRVMLRRRQAFFHQVISFLNAPSAAIVPVTPPARPSTPLPPHRVSLEHIPGASPRAHIPTVSRVARLRNTSPADLPGTSMACLSRATTAYFVYLSIHLAITIKLLSTPLPLGPASSNKGTPRLAVTISHEAAQLFLSAAQERHQVFLAKRLHSTVSTQCFSRSD